MNDVDASRVNDKVRGAIVIDLAAVRANAARAYGVGPITPSPDDSSRAHWTPLLMLAALILLFAVIR